MHVHCMLGPGGKVVGRNKKRWRRDIVEALFEREGTPLLIPKRSPMLRYEYSISPVAGS